ncbi:MAG: hypothetical protein IPL47_13595 [Phyllobacteriaceae bacterium]|nr:hypothetical protein [Phyllobacteriaceae bacterium]
MVLAAAFAAGLALNAGYGLDRINQAADEQLSALFGRPVDALFAKPRVSLEGFGAIAVEVSDASVRTDAGAIVAQADELGFVVDLPTLALGRLALSGISAKEATIDLAAISPSGDDSDRATIWRALADPDAMAKAVFSGVSGLITSLDRAGADRINLENVTLDWGPAEGDAIAVSRLRARRSGLGLQMAIDLRQGGQDFSIAADALLAAGGERVAQLNAAINLPAFGESGDAFFTAPARLTLTGSQTGVERLILNLQPTDLTAAPDSYSPPIALAISLNAEIAVGSNKIELRELRAEGGRTQFVFNGALTAGAGKDGALRYELVSDRSTVAPADSPESPVDFVARIAGTIDPLAKAMVAEEIGVRTSGGEIHGTASMTLSDGKAPATYLAISIPNGLPVAHAKQLWPIGAAPSARHWVLDKLFGGQVTEGFLEMRLQPGRLTEGYFTAEEISGHFAVAGSRFDIAGDMPPVRDAAGTIDFAGDDVKIGLVTGKAYMATGRSVEGKSGTLTISDAAKLPVVGKLKLSVSGSADAIAELASYKPIDASRRLPVGPDALSGSVTGEVEADIPLSTTGEAYSAVYAVALDFTDLDIASDFDGQKISDAAGRIEITPERATIKAKARLNGVPAEVTLVEPLRSSGGERAQKIVLVVDEKTQKTLAPGLSSIVEGSFSVEMAKAGQGRRTAKADLAKARINLPWVGWSKGAGVPAIAEFSYEALKDGSSRISDFRLTGKTFAIAGDMVVRGDALASAEFNRVKLNAGDEASVTIKRNGKGYDVRLTGKSLDGRALIKEVLADPVAAGETIGTTPVNLKAEIGSVTGFSGEKLGGLTLIYTGTGKMVANLVIEAKSSGGGDVSITNKAKGENREVRMASSDAGALLRFLDIYERMRGGSITMALAGGLTGALTGEIDARNFEVVNEPRLKSLVSSRPNDADKSLSETLDKEIDTSVVKFERGFSRITKGRGLLTLDRGILRGPLIGFSFQGTFYDPKENMAMTGTMMPAYGLNRIFGELPLIGLILGNGDDKGLIGITFKLAGKAKDPVLTVNPLSLIAPGIFRSIFEFKKS